MSQAVRLVTAVVGWLARVALAIAALLDGEASGTAALENEDFNEPRSRSDSWAAGRCTAQAELAANRLKGSVAQRQPDLRRSIACRWRGVGSFIDGTLDVTPSELRWSPSRRWAARGARDFLVRREDVQESHLLPVFPRRLGLTLTLQDDGEAWILARDESLLVQALEAWCD